MIKINRKGVCIKDILKQAFVAFNARFRFSDLTG